MGRFDSRFSEAFLREGFIISLPMEGGLPEDYLSHPSRRMG